MSKLPAILNPTEKDIHVNIINYNFNLKIVNSIKYTKIRNKKCYNRISLLLKLTLVLRMLTSK